MFLNNKRRSRISIKLCIALDIYDDNQEIKDYSRLNLDKEQN